MIGQIIVSESGEVKTLIHFAHRHEGRVVLACMRNAERNHFHYSGEQSAVNCRLCQDRKSVV